MEALFPSPPTMQRWGTVMATALPWSRLPSIRHTSGVWDSPSMARFMASIRAFKISISSISAAETEATQYTSAWAVMSSYRASRFFSVSFLESLMP